MRTSFVLLLTVIAALKASGQQPANEVWSELKAKRAALSGLHQEFEVSQTFLTDNSSKGWYQRLFIDISQKQWREQYSSGSIDRIRVFDGENLFLMEAGGNEYVRVKKPSKNSDPEPEPYGGYILDWTKAQEVGRRPCGFSKHDHPCLIIDVPVKGWVHLKNASQKERLVSGVNRVTIDTDTGAVVLSDSMEVIDNGRGEYKLHRTYVLKQLSYGKALDSELFKLPEGLHEVKGFTKWDAGRIKKELAGKPAPELQVTDMKGNPLSLGSLKGKTVLLDFWTTWCPPCRADAPALDKLYEKYGGKNLVIVGISVGEAHRLVEKFLQEHPHAFPIILTSENDMPRPYEVAAFPTYMVITPDGTLNSVFEGDQGFGELKKHLRKAGMEVE